MIFKASWVILLFNRILILVRLSISTGLHLSSPLVSVSSPWARKAAGVPPAVAVSRGALKLVCGAIIAVARHREFYGEQNSTFLICKTKIIVRSVLDLCALFIE